MRRTKMKKSKSRRLFRKTASKVNARNYARAMRGGYRI